MSVSGFTMKDRGKFQVFEREARLQHQVETTQKDAIEKQEDAALKKDGDVPMSDLQARMGRPIQVGVFISTLKRLNPNLLFQISLGDPTKYGIYVAAMPEPRFITGMESGLNLGGRINEGVMPEFSILVNTTETVLDNNNVVRSAPKFQREIRGWRTVVAALFLDGLLTDTQIESTFHISQGRGSENWQRRVRPGIRTSGG